MLLRPKHWDKFQHYKDRRPPWIKLHRDLLDNFDYARLPVASKAIAPLLWLLASEYQDGVIEASIEELAFRLRIDDKTVKEGVKHLIDKGFFVDDSTMLASCLQDAIPETEKERETETEKETDLRKPERSALSLLSDFGIDGQLAKDFIALRKEKKAAITETALNRMKTQSVKAGLSMQEAVEICIERNWQGFNADWYQEKPKTVLKQVISEADINRAARPGETRDQVYKRLQAALG